LLHAESQPFGISLSEGFDLKIPGKLTKFIAENSIDTVINCAAKVGGLYSQMKLPASYLHQNLLLTDSLYESVSKSCPSAFLVNFLSTCCFPTTVSYPISTEQLHAGPPHHTNASYSYAKRMIDIYAQAYYREHKVSSTLFVFGNLFGKYDNFIDPENAHVIPSLIVKAHNALKFGHTSFEIFGDGAPLREFLYVDDASKCVSLYLETIVNGQAPEILLFSNPNEISIFKLSNLIAKIVSPANPLEVIKTPVVDQGQLRKPSETSAKLLNFFRHDDFTSLEEALREVYVFYAEGNPI
jgi:GDP-L-fucose synthase